VEDTKALLATDDPKHYKNLKRRHGPEDGFPIADKSKKPKCPNCGNKHNGKCNQDLATCSLCKGKRHLARFCVNSSTSAPKRQQSNNDDKASEAKHKANLKRGERQKKAKAGANLVKEAEKEDKPRENDGYPLTLALPGTAREKNPLINMALAVNDTTRTEGASRHELEMSTDDYLEEPNSDEQLCQASVKYEEPSQITQGFA
jgi:hypothetical protein